MELPKKNGNGNGVKKIPYYKNVLLMLTACLTTILAVYIVSCWMAINEPENYMEAHNIVIQACMGLLMLTIGGAVAMFERLIPKRDAHEEDEDEA